MIFRWRAWMILALASLLSTAALGQASSGPTEANAAAQAKADPAYPFIEQALASLKKQDLRGAVVQIDQGLKANPHSAAARVLMGSIYASKRLLPEAEEQFTLAAQDAPANGAIQFYLADIKLSEGNYEAARTIYAALEKTPGREDYVAYKVFLCDLMGKQEARAAAELAAFKQPPLKPSHYFANAAWCVTQHNSAGAKKLLDTAATAFSMPENLPYAQALQTLGFLPLPAN